jgi:hypothetical protein
MKTYRIHGIKYVQGSGFRVQGSGFRVQGLFVIKILIVLYHPIQQYQEKLVRFAHNWNDRTLEYWNNGFWKNGKLDYCKIPLDVN